MVDSAKLVFQKVHKPKQSTERSSAEPDIAQIPPTCRKVTWDVEITEILSIRRKATTNIIART
jgi:hypothetical protein